MNNAQREFLTLSFSNEGLDRGAKEETFEPWDLTLRVAGTQTVEPCISSNESSHGDGCLYS